MKINLLTKRVLGFVFGLSLLLGVGMTASSTAQAQWQNPDWQREQARRQREWEREQRRRQREADRDWRDNDRYRDRRYNDPYRDRRYNDPYNDPYGYGGSAQLRQTALNAGYNQGIKEGRRDRSRGERYEFRDSSAYQNATTDYNSRLGSRALYQQYYRQGFENGYADGYRGY